MNFGQLKNSSLKVTKVTQEDSRKVHCISHIMSHHSLSLSIQINAPPLSPLFVVAGMPQLADFVFQEYHRRIAALQAAHQMAPPPTEKGIDAEGEEQEKEVEAEVMETDVDRDAKEDDAIESRGKQGVESTASTTVSNENTAAEEESKETAKEENENTVREESKETAEEENKETAEEEETIVE